jgi:hypothetical protein
MPANIPGRAQGASLADDRTALDAAPATEAVDWDPVDPDDGDPLDLADWELAEPPDWDAADLADLEPPDPYWELEQPARSPEAERRAAARSREAPNDGARHRSGGEGGWFAAGGAADDLPPGPVLAGFAADTWAIGLGRLTDDELIGMMRAARRLASWAAALEFAAVGDLWRRRWAEEQAGHTGAARHADDEIAAALTLTGRAANQELSLAVALRRLPLTSRGLAAGDIDVPRAMVIADEVTGLDNEHAAAVEQVIIGAAAGQTTGQLRAAARRAVLAADPRAARRRKERALQDARVERWDEHAGTAALAGRDLPPASVLAADRNLSALARQLKGAGAAGTLDQLRAQIYLALLTGTSVSALIPPGPSGPGGAGSPGTSGAGSLGTSGAGSPGIAGAGTPGGTGAPGWNGAAGSQGPLFASGSVNLTMPLATWLGLSEAPGSAGGYGPLDADDSRAIAAALAARAGTKWCLTLTDSHGRPVAHGCARAGPPGQRRTQWPTGPPGKPGTGLSDGPARPAGDESGAGGGSGDGRAGAPRDGPGASSGTTTPGAGQTDGTGGTDRTGTRATDRPWAFSLTLLAGDGCSHARETAAYRPSATLRHLIEIRHATCTYPGCRRPATRCDADHTVAYHRGGRTCLCNLAPLCRKHHQAKQAPGWYLGQPLPGVLAWTTPTGRTYTTGPTVYPD